MTVCCSNLPNDQDLIKTLGDQAIPIPHLWTDCTFGGVGDDEKELLIAVERKKIGDIAQCINDGRFLFQVQVCKEMGADVMALIVEGEYRRNPEDGLLDVPVWMASPETGKQSRNWVPVKPTMEYNRFDQYLTELDYLAGIIVKRSADVKETAAIIMALYDNFQTPPSKHESLHQIFSPPPNTVELFRPTLIRRMAKELPGVGWEKSREIADYFGSVIRMATAKEEEWLKVPGIGKKTARKVVHEMRSGGHNNGKKMES